ncbi:MAG: hypothetical protein KAW47_05800 [Thermoplasmatales archaeon]|nr:hypothetical protein [Thermoplasmatales archaeon]
MKNPRGYSTVINIIGIDGSGKSTLAKKLAMILTDRGINCCYIYCQFFAKLLYPLKVVARHSVMRKTDEFADYATYIKKKIGFSKKHHILGTIYALLWLIDYSMQAFLKVNRVVGRDRVIIIDRYVYDIAVNVSITAGWTIKILPHFLNIMFKMHPRPDIVIYLDLPEEIAFSRKNDIQSIDYLKERRERYLWLTEHYNFQIIDGAKSVDTILGEVIERCALNISFTGL